MLSERDREETSTGECPMLSLDPAPAGLDRATRLALPLAKSAWIERHADGITLWHGTHEITFDDPAQFAFAEGLIGRGAFVAAEVCDWSGLDWPHAAALLADLLAAGVLVPEAEAPAPLRHEHQSMAEPLPPAPMTAPRAWTDPASLMEELTGTALDPYWLECVVPVFRVAHCFLDRDGRQVGEANTFPAAARLQVQTDWRGCAYPGNRYQAEKPINLTALKAMRAHWREILALLKAMRGVYLARCPEAAPDAQGRWTVGHLERLTCGVLALPSQMLLRGEGRVANGDLHPALSSLFRVTDGLRLVMHQMLFVPVHETMRSPDERVNAAAILAYADRNFAFHSAHAVCAGPRFMVEDMLGVLLEGREPRGGMASALNGELAEAIALADEALDYAFLGLETFGTVFALWPAMTRAYARMHALLAEAGASEGPVAGLAARFAQHFDALRHRSYLADEAWRAHREAVYDDMIAQCRRARTGRALRQALAAPADCSPLPAGAGRRSAELPGRAIAATLGPGHAALAENLAAEIMDFLERGRQIVACAERVQAEIADLLGRPAPAHRLTLAQLNLHNVLMGEDQRSLPFLPNEVAALFGLVIEVDADGIRFTDAPVRDRSPHSAGPGPFGSRDFAQA